MIDSSSIRVHPQAANAQKRWSIPLLGSLARRGGLTTRIHALVDALGHPPASGARDPLDTHTEDRRFSGYQSVEGK